MEDKEQVVIRRKNYPMFIITILLILGILVGLTIGVIIGFKYLKQRTSSNTHSHYYAYQLTTDRINALFY